MSRQTTRHGVGGIFIDGDVLMRDDLTTTAKLVYGYACKYVVTDDRQRDGGLEVGQVWLRTRQRHGDRPGVDEALGVSHGAVVRAIESLIEHGLLRYAKQPTMAERRAGKVTVYWIASMAPVRAVEPDSPQNVDSDSPHIVDSDSPRNEVSNSPQNGVCDSPRNGGCLYEESLVRSDSVVAAAAAATVDDLVDLLNRTLGGGWTAGALRTRLEPVLAAHHELTIADHDRVIRHVLAGTKFWTGAARPNIVYGSLEQFERCLAEAQQPETTTTAATGAPADGLEQWERDDLQAYRNTREPAFLTRILEEGSPAARAAAEQARPAHHQVTEEAAA